MIAIASDHAGYLLKEEIRHYLNEQGVAHEDLGTYSPNSVDYPLYGERLARGVAAGKYEKGILFCGTGIGISISANKVNGIRCCACSDVLSAKMSRLHNNTNVLALGARIIGVDTAKMIVDTWLNTPFSNEERHERRIALFSEIEKRNPR